MTYRIELEKINKKYSWEDKNEYAYSSLGVKDYLKNCIEEGYKVARILRTTKDGRATDVTKTYLR